MFKSGAAGGIQSILKDGGKHFAGVDDAVLKNIDAAKQISQLTKSSFGPHGMSKLIVNHLDKHFITRDAAVMLTEMEVMHPAAKLVVMAAKSQEQECGDGTNFVSILSGELLVQAEEMLKQGVHVADIVRGFELALKHTLTTLTTATPTLTLSLSHSTTQAELAKYLQTAVASKQYGQEEVIANLVATACLQSYPKAETARAGEVNVFNADDVRIAKLVGGGDLYSSYVVSGCVVGRDAMGHIKNKNNCKVAVFSVGLEMTNTETGGQVLITTADELLNFTKGEETRMEQFVKELAAAGVGCVITGGSVQDLALHYLNLYDIMTVKVTSKFELKRLADAIGAAQMVRLGCPLPEETGYAESVRVEEVSSQKITVVKSRDSRISTIVLRGATVNALEEVERAVVDSVNLFRCLAVKNELVFVYGAGAAEVLLAERVRQYAGTHAGLEQYGVAAFAEALDAVVRCIADNAGLRGNEVLASVLAAQQSGKKTACVDVTGVNGGVGDAAKIGVYDHLSTKSWAIRLAVDAALTILRTQHIIVAKQAGMPTKPKGESNVDDD